MSKTKQEIVEYKHKWYLKNKLHHSLKCKKYYKEHRREILEYLKKYQNENKEKLSLKQREYYLNNKEYFIKYKKLWRLKNREKLLIRDKERYKNNNFRRNYWKNNREICINKQRERRKSNHEIYLLQAKIYIHKRREKLKFTDIDIKWLNELFNKTTHCELCNKEMENNSKYPNGKHLDHILPICVGGQHMKNNVRFICAECNISRPKDGRDLLKAI